MRKRNLTAKQQKKTEQPPSSAANLPIDLTKVNADRQNVASHAKQSKMNQNHLLQQNSSSNELLSVVINGQTLRKREEIAAVNCKGKDCDVE